MPCADRDVDPVVFELQMPRRFRCHRLEDEYHSGTAAVLADVRLHAALVAALAAHCDGAASPAVDAARKAVAAIAAVAQFHSHYAVALVVAGGGRGVVAAMRAHRSERDMARTGCVALAYLAAGVAMATELSSEGLLDWSTTVATEVMEVLTRFGDDPEVVVPACDAIYALAAGSRVAVAKLVVGGAENSLLTLLHRHVAVAAVVVVASGALAALSRMGAAGAVLRCPHAASTVMAAAASHAADAHIAAACADVLRVLLRAAGGRHPALDPAAIGATLIDMLARHPTCPPLVEVACTALVHVAGQRHTVETLVRHGAGRVILAAMDACGSSTRAVTAGCAVLGELATTDTNRAALRDLGAAARLTEALNAHGHDDTAVYGAAVAVGALAGRVDTRAHLAAAGVVPPLARALQTHVDDAATAAACTGTLAALSEDDTAQAAMVGSDVTIAALLTALRGHPVAQRNSVRALRQLAAVPGHRQRLLDAGAALALATALQRRPDDAVLALLAVSVLAFLLEVPGGLQTLERGQIVALVNAVADAAGRHHASSSPSLAQAACNALCCLARPRGGLPVETRELAARIVVEALNRHRDVAEVATAGCQALWTFACPAARERLHAARATHALLDTLAAHVDNATIVAYACYALACLAASCTAAGDVMYEGGATTTTIRVLQRHGGSVEALRAACSVLHNLALVPAYRIPMYRDGAGTALITVLQTNVGNRDLALAAADALINLAATRANKVPLYRDGAAAAALVAQASHPAADSELHTTFDFLLVTLCRVAANRTAMARDGVPRAVLVAGAVSSSVVGSDGRCCVIM